MDLAASSENKVRRSSNTANCCHLFVAMSIPCSLDKYNARTNNEQSGKKLVKRREALKELLEQENCEYEVLLKECN